MCARLSGDAAAVAAALSRAERLVLTTHARPDGDALGSAAAVWRAASAAGKACRIVVPDDVPRRFAFLFAGGAPDGPERFAAAAGAADAVVVLDTCAFAQVEPIADALRAVRAKVVVVDHHATADDVAPLVWRDVTAAAVGVMVAELLGELGWPVDAAAAEALAAAVLTDTGWLRFANTDARALRVAAGLIDGGVRPDALYARLYQSDRPERLRLLAAVLGSLTLHAGGRLAMAAATAEDFARTGAAADETEDFVNEPLRIGSVEVSALLVARADGPIRVSLRSRGGVDVAAVAARFGGGGHAQAAGYRTGGDLAAARAALLTACAEALPDGR